MESSVQSRINNIEDYGQLKPVSRILLSWILFNVNRGFFLIETCFLMAGEGGPEYEAYTKTRWYLEVPDFAQIS